MHCIRLSVRASIRPFVHLSVCPSVRLSVSGFVSVRVCTACVRTPVYQLMLFECVHVGQRLCECGENEDAFVGCCARFGISCEA